ncbi:BON domain-containing protein [Pandoraea nosoerga]|uniref:Transport-associated protein n=1 Tax=Pandoraea nosoerga TaxID=2508296 RepID=A0A5E4SS74_9BURK|nr:BON domain-containing protein [Pandoraea nosoerga]MBN4666428.1 BON domain-containing protein [Pandoraea nosoerga]MBN4677627.1 BON domain-containing protein [Pandoraea nosoerga]MBN4682549.1 BON domain-containing protein [Pandoraea nosoerga]MBN4745588.1 BON domain-containing protein [Pandoraea nosoerga]VVD77981.1 transport-associated protein [Pandoraea nosoerga]
MAKRNSPSPAGAANEGVNKEAKKGADEGRQNEEHVLTHEDGDAETVGGGAQGADALNGPGGTNSAASHETRQSAMRNAQTAQAAKQSDPAWLGASNPKRGAQQNENTTKASSGESSAAPSDTRTGSEAGHQGARGSHGYAPEIAHGEESGYGPGNASPGEHPRFGRQSGYGPHDDYAGTGRNAAGHVPSPPSPAQSRRVEWPQGTVGAQAALSTAEAGPGAVKDDERRSAKTGVRGQPQHTAHASVRASSHGASGDDTVLRDAVRKALLDARDLDVARVDVSVHSGLVLLTGSVPERSMQHVVESVVAKVPGVTGVDNRLHERREKPMSRPGESQEGHKI